MFHKRRLLRQAELALFHFLCAFSHYKLTWQLEQRLRFYHRLLGE